MRGRRARRHRFFGGEPGEGAVLTLRLNKRYLDFVDAYAKRYGATRSGTLRAMLERIAMPVLENNPDALLDKGVSGDG